MLATTFGMLAPVLRDERTIGIPPRVSHRRGSQMTHVRGCLRLIDQGVRRTSILRHAVVCFLAAIRPYLCPTTFGQSRCGQGVCQDVSVSCDIANILVINDSFPFEAWQS